VKTTDGLDNVNPGHAGWGVPREKTVTWYDPMLSASAVSLSSGLEFLRAIRDGKLPPPPIAKLFGFAIKEVEPGRVVFECVPDESAYNPIGVVHGGLVCTLADTVTACALQTTLQAGVTYTSIDLNVSYLRPVTKDTGLLRATGTVTKPGRRVGFSSAEIAGEDGKLVATATSSCLVMGDA
jgi:uncharacterized protein (TIGR00369 family)